MGINMCAVSPNRQPLQMCFCSALIHCYPFEGFIHLIRSVPSHIHAKHSVFYLERRAAKAKSIDGFVIFHQHNQHSQWKSNHILWTFSFFAFSLVDWWLYTENFIWYKYILVNWFNLKNQKKKCVLSEET